MDINYTIVLLTGLFMTPIVALVVFYLWRRNQKIKDEEYVYNMINNSLKYEDEAVTNPNIQVRFVKYWSNLLKESGLVHPNTDDNKIAMYITMILMASFLLVFAVTFNFIAAIIPPIVILWGIKGYCEKKVIATDNMVREQIPSFLSALKSNIQANATPELALMGAIENTTEPLYSELKVVKGLIETGSFESALAALRRRTNNEHLQFLCSCIELSNEVGANLEEQIEEIENMIKARQELTRKTDSAVAENTPILYVACAMIPSIFIYTYVMNEGTREYWFHSFTSWVLFIFVLCLMFGGTKLGKRIIQKVRDMM